MWSPTKDVSLWYPQPTPDELYHHGILGMKHGVRNGPPYPLGAGDHSSSEKKAGWRKSLGGGKAKSDSNSMSSVDSIVKYSRKRFPKGYQSHLISSNEDANGNETRTEVQTDNRKGKNKGLLVKTEYDAKTDREKYSVRELDAKETKEMLDKASKAMDKQVDKDIKELDELISTPVNDYGLLEKKHDLTKDPEVNVEGFRFYTGKDGIHIGFSTDDYGPSPNDIDTVLTNWKSANKKEILNSAKEYAYEINKLGEWFNGSKEQFNKLFDSQYEIGSLYITKHDTEVSVYPKENVSYVDAILADHELSGEYDYDFKKHPKDWTMNG